MGSKRRQVEKQLRVKATPEAWDEYADTARSWGYSELAPFVRRLMDAAKRGNRETGVIQFFRGSDAAARAA